MRQREPRQAVIVPARIRAGSLWADAQIRNASSGGMLLHLAAPPARGTYVEIARGRLRLTGRVAWTGNGRCGIQTREKVRIADLIGGSAPTTTDLPADGPPRRGPDRRKADRSRSAGRAMEFCSAVAFSICAVGALVTPAYATLASTLETVRANL